MRGLFVTIAALMLCVGCGEDASNDDDDNEHEENEDEAVEMPSPITGQIGASPVTLKYAVAKSFVDGQYLLGSQTSVVPGEATTFVVVLSDNPIHCGTDIATSRQPDGFYVAFRFPDDSVGAQAIRFAHLHVHDGWVDAGVSDGEAALTASDGSTYTGTANQSQDVELVGEFQAQSCPD